LTKPFSDDVLLSAIRSAIDRSQTALGHEAELRELRHGYASLSRREREVMTWVVAGLLNKQIGGELGISEITVKAHRGKVMRKMRAGSLADLVNMAARLQLAPPPSAPTVQQRSSMPGPPETVAGVSSRRSRGLATHADMVPVLLRRPGATRIMSVTASRGGRIRIAGTSARAPSHPRTRALV
jgi:DNA-binding CsgD family transcriptional regulator